MSIWRGRRLFSIVVLASGRAPAGSLLFFDPLRSSASTVGWSPIRYREFYDLPRLFIAEHGGAVYVFDCPFDRAVDRYSERYQVYRLPVETAAAAGDGSWEGLVHAGSFVGEVLVEAVRFDPTRRAAIDDTIFDEL